VEIAEGVPVCEVVDGCEDVEVVEGCEDVLVDALPRTELLLDILDELRTLLSALELALFAPCDCERAASRAAMPTEPGCAPRAAAETVAP